MRRLAALCMAAVSLLAACGGASGERVVIAAGTTLVDSGFLQLVVDAYERGHDGVELSIVGLGSAEAIAYAEAGSADVIVTHNKDLLDQLIDRVPRAHRTSPFASTFVVLGPPGMQGAASPVDLFASVAQHGVPFVSRDDGSGTNAKEREIWALVPHDPSGDDWYVRTGSGMGATLLVANEKGAVTLSELGAWLTARDGLRLSELPITDTALLDNPYEVTVLFPAELPEAADFQGWLMTESGRAAIVAANDELFGRQVYRTP